MSAEILPFRPVTARDVSDAADAKPLRRFGSATVERVQIRPVSVKPVKPSERAWNPDGDAA